MDNESEHWLWYSCLLQQWNGNIAITWSFCWWLMEISSVHDTWCMMRPLNGKVENPRFVWWWLVEQSSVYDTWCSMRLLGMRILGPFLLFSLAFRLAHLLAGRKDGEIPTVVLCVWSLDQIPGLEGVGSVWQCLESRWSQDTEDKPGFGRLSFCWFVRLQDWKM